MTYIDAVTPKSTGILVNCSFVCTNSSQINLMIFVNLLYIHTNDVPRCPDTYLPPLHRDRQRPYVGAYLRATNEVI